MFKLLRLRLAESLDHPSIAVCLSFKGERGELGGEGKEAVVGCVTGVGIG
jgi:hypothetical protein